MVSLTTGKSTSKQDYATPPEFIRAVEGRYGPVVFDLAASPHNTKYALYFSERQNSLTQEWSRAAEGPGVLWLNPPFGNITPFAKKCADEQARLRPDQVIAMLVTAAVGSNWFRDFVWKKASVDLLNGRICFDGKNGYPKDCLLAVFRRVIPLENDIGIWRWTDGRTW